MHGNVNIAAFPTTRQISVDSRDGAFTVSNLPLLAIDDDMETEEEMQRDIISQQAECM